MKKKWLILFSLLILGTVLVAFNYDKTVSLTKKLLYYSPCDNPIHYEVGSIDQRFNLTRDQVLDDISQAASIWDNAEGKQLFTYDPKGILTISFVYDERQALNTKIQNLNQTLKTEKSSLDPQLAEYRRLSNDFQTRLAALNTSISYWNSRGGAPQDEYNKLISEQKSLQQEADTLNAMAKSLNQSADTFNAGVTQLNQTVDTFNQTLQVKPEEGLYDGNNNTIDIFFTNGKNELIHTLAHELGHAMGLVHVANPKGIMYAQTNSEILPSSDDITALTAICTPKSVFVIAGERLAYLVSVIQQFLSTPAVK